MRPEHYIYVKGKKPKRCTCGNIIETRGAPNISGKCGKCYDLERPRRGKDKK